MRRYHFTQQHLTIPGRYDVAGASLIGSPAINTGWNKNVAWSHTVSTAYLSSSGLRQLERRTVKVRVKRPDGQMATVTEDLYRTPQRYVIDSPATFMG